MVDVFKSVTDPVHGNIGLTRVEAEIMTSAIMQRLHNVRQLGLAHLVYPGANYSRFSHSVGACHNASKLLASACMNSGANLDDELVQNYRIVALLHDIGHYPFSHATEHVVENYYAGGLTSAAANGSALLQGDANSQVLVAPEMVASVSEDGVNDSSANTKQSPLAYGHEPLGEQIIRTNSELRKIFDAHGLKSDTIADIFSKAKPDPLIGIISSDLDCDRLDYLRRTAHNSGAPYGSVDTNFLIQQATFDVDGTFCFLPKAARAADHLLVSRFYDYMQVPFNKTVVALEWSLVEGLKALLGRGLIDCSGSKLEHMVIGNEWNYFDDQMVFGKFRELLSAIESEQKATVLRDHLFAVLDRKPAKMIAGWDEVISRKDESGIAKNVFIAKMILNSICDDLSLDPDRWHIWDTPVYFSKADGSINPEHQPEERIAEAVQFLNPDTNRASLLIARKDTIVRHLSSLQMAGLRLYHLSGEAELDPKVKLDIIRRFSDALGRPTM